MSQKQTPAIGAIVNLNDYPPEKYNVLAPITMIQATNSLQKPDVRVVSLDTRIDKAGAAIGNDIYKERSSGKYAVTKVGGAKLAAAAGIATVSSESVQPDVCIKCIQMAKSTGKAQPCGTCPHQYDVKYKVTVSVPSPSGEIRYITKDKEIDCSLEKESMKPDQYKRFLPHRASHAESKAFMRCLRDALGLAAGYTIEELQRPFVIARMVPNLDAPELREAVAGNYLQSMGLLFGGAPGQQSQLPPSDPAQRQEAPALPEAGEFHEDDYPDANEPIEDSEPLPWENEADGVYCEGCGIEITETRARNGKMWSPEAIKGYSERTFGRCLCTDCQQDAKGGR